MGGILGVAFVLVAVYYAITEGRKPDRWLGRIMLVVMNMTHSAMTDWGMNHVRIGKKFTILDIGCGGGRTVRKLAAVASEGKVYGVDYAAGSIAASLYENAKLIAAGRVKIRQASVDHLPFRDNSFDLVTAIESHYYWPNLAVNMREILRVLKPAGSLVIVVENYKGGSNIGLYRSAMRFLKSNRLTVYDHMKLFSSAGYAGVEIFEEFDNGWLCAVGTKQ